MKKSKLGSRIVSWFRNVRLGYKLAIVYALSGFLPVVAVLSVTYVQMKQILLQRETVLNRICIRHLPQWKLSLQSTQI